MNTDYIIRTFRYFAPKILLSAALIYAFKVKPGLLKMSSNYPTGSDVNKGRVVLEVAARVAYYFTMVYLVMQIFLLALNLLPVH